MCLCCLDLVIFSISLFFFCQGYNVLALIVVMILSSPIPFFYGLTVCGSSRLYGKQLKRSKMRSMPSIPFTIWSNSGP